MDRWVDAVVLRSDLRELLDGLPATPTSNETAERWAGDTLEAFVAWLTPQVLSVELTTTAEGLMDLYRRVLPAFVLGEPVTGLGRAATAELENIRRHFRLGRAGSPWRIEAPWDVPVLYAEALGLTKGGVIMPSGQVFLSQGDQGARRWLATLELAQGSRAGAGWHLEHWELSSLLAHPRNDSDLAQEAGDYWPRDRLEHLGLVRIDRTAPFSFYKAQEAEIRAVLDESSPMWALARALTPDPASTLPLPNGLPQQLGAQQAGRAAAELAQMSAHELGNVLPLLEGSVDQLAAALRGTPLEEPTSRHVERIGQNITRLYRYTEWFAEMGRSLDRPPERFGARAMLEDAVQLANGGGVETDLNVVPELSLYGLRDRLIIALVNLLRNARQHGAKRVRLGARAEQQQLYLEIDDDGPGVSPEKEAMVFVAAFTTRAEGSGQGLPLARRVIEEEHRGSIGYARSPLLGGARFTVRLPI